MAKIVELLGPSGVGKSSLYLELQNRWHETDNWATYHDFIYPRKKGSAATFLLKVKSLWAKIHNSDYFWNEGILKNSQRNFAELHPEFMSILMDLIQEHTKKGYNGEDKRFLVTFFTLKSIGRLQSALDRENDSRTCLIDEALLSRIMHLNSPTFSNNDLEKYLQSMPLPDGLIYLNAPSEVVLSRLQKRNKKATIHEGLSNKKISEYTQNTQALMEKVITHLLKQNIPILRLDARKTTRKIAEEAISFLSEKVR